MVSILALSGFILVFLEFFLPGGIMAAGGSLLLLAALILLFVQAASLWVFLLSCAGIGLGLFVTIRLALARVRKQKVVLSTDQEGFQACSFAEEMIGKTAKVSSDLKPSGFITIDDSIYSALSEEGYIEQGTLVHVIGGRGSYLIVQKEHFHDR